MDLSFSRDATTAPAVRTPAVAALLADAGVRQAASTTAHIARDLTPRHATNPWTVPQSGAFSAATAAALTRWKQL